MKIKTLLPIIALAIMVAMGACSTDELMPDAKPDTNPQGRTITFTASMPGDGHATRVALTPEADKSITLTWEVGDKLQLAFVQGATKVKHTVTLTAQDITNQGKKAIFELVIPDEIVEGPPFDLYGVYGGGKRKLNIGVGLPGTDVTGDVGIGSFYTGDALVLGDASTNPYIKLPTNAGSATSLAGANGASIQNRKDVMLYFQSTGVDLSNPDISVAFQHLGSLFCITLKNTGIISLDNLKEMQLVGINNPDNQNWAYNSAEGGQTYDLVTKEFNTTATISNHISFRAAQNSVPADGTITFWGWYPPMPEVNWPSLELLLIDGTTNTIAVSKNFTPARTAETPAGKAYYFYAAHNGAELNFTNEAFSTELTINVAEMGTLSTLLPATQKSIIKKLTVTGQINKADYDVMKLEMPGLTHIDLSQVTSYEGETIHKIPNNAFGEDIGLSMANVSRIINTNQNLESIILPTSVTSIGDFAFSYCSTLTGELKLPAGLTTIGESAFAFCDGFTSDLIIPNKVTTIGNYAFYYCSEFDGILTLSDNLINIGEEAFAYCSGFTSTLIIPDNVVEIRNDAFIGCTNITGPIAFPLSLNYLGAGVFDDCDMITSFEFPHTTLFPYQTGLDYYGYEIFMLPAGATIKVLPSLVETYKADPNWHPRHTIEKMFTGRVVNVPTMGTLGTILTADDKASVTELKVTGQIKAVDFEVMNSMPNLTYIDMSKVICQGNKIPDQAFGAYMEGGNKTITTVILPESVTAIGSRAFAGCSSLAGNLKLPAGLITIEFAAFINCKSLSGSLIIPASVTTIGSSAFEYTRFTGDLVLPTKLTTIGSKAFYGCSGFTGTLILPTDLKTIGSNAFIRCSGFTGELALPAQLTSIDDSAFNGCTGLTSLTFESESQLSAIGERAFASCSQISGVVVFPTTLTSIGSEGFDGCESVNEFQFLNPTPIKYTYSMLQSGIPVTVPTSQAVADYQTMWDANASRHNITVPIE